MPVGGGAGFVTVVLVGERLDDAVEQVAQRLPLGLRHALEGGGDDVVTGLERLLQAGAAGLGDLDPAGPAVVRVVGALEQPAVLELPGVPADGGGVEPQRLGERGEPHRALVQQQLEDREGGVVDDVAGLLLPQPAAERHHQAEQGVLGRLRAGTRPVRGPVRGLRRSGGRTVACGKHTSLCVHHTCFRP